MNAPDPKCLVTLAVTAGGGIRALIGRRAFFGAEGRIGWEAHVRLNAIIGVRLGD